MNGMFCAAFSGHLISAVAFFSFLALLAIPIVLQIRYARKRELAEFREVIQPPPRPHISDTQMRKLLCHQTKLVPRICTLFVERPKYYTHTPSEMGTILYL